MIEKAKELFGGTEWIVGQVKEEGTTVFGEMSPIGLLQFIGTLRTKFPDEFKAIADMKEEDFDEADE